MIEKKYIKELYDISDKIDDVVRELRHLRFPVVELTDDEKSKIRECEQQLYNVSDVIFNIYSSNNYDHKAAEKKAYDEVFMSANRNSESFKVFSGTMVNK